MTLKMKEVPPINQNKLLQSNKLRRRRMELSSKKVSFFLYERL